MTAASTDRPSWHEVLVPLYCALDRNLADQLAPGHSLRWTSCPSKSRERSGHTSELGGDDAPGMTSTGNHARHSSDLSVPINPIRKYKVGMSILAGEVESAFPSCAFRLAVKLCLTSISHKQLNDWGHYCSGHNVTVVFRRRDKLDIQALYDIPLLSGLRGRSGQFTLAATCPTGGGLARIDQGAAPA